MVHLLGTIVQWEREKGLTTGATRVSQSRSEDRGSMRYETMLLQADDGPDPKKLDIAKKLLVSSNLPQDLVKWCCRQMSLN
jgi:hypothetical protein